MSEFASKAPAQVTIPIEDSDQILPVRRSCAASAGTMRRMPSTWGTTDRRHYPVAGLFRLWQYVNAGRRGVQIRSPDRASCGKAHT
jgi:hypothetical protein